MFISLQKFYSVTMLIFPVVVRIDKHLMSFRANKHQNFIRLKCLISTTLWVIPYQLTKGPKYDHLQFC